MEIGHVAAKDPVQPTSMNRVLKVNRKTPAAQWNRRILKTLSPALEKDPEADLLSVLPNFYSKTLAGLREGSEYCPALRTVESLTYFFSYRTQAAKEDLPTRAPSARAPSARHPITPPRVRHRHHRLNSLG